MTLKEGLASGVCRWRVDPERDDSLKVAPEASRQPHPSPGPVGPF